MKHDDNCPQLIEIFISPTFECWEGGAFIILCTFTEAVKLSNSAFFFFVQLR